MSDESLNISTEDKELGAKPLSRKPASDKPAASTIADTPARPVKRGPGRPRKSAADADSGTTGNARKRPRNGSDDTGSDEKAKTRPKDEPVAPSPRPVTTRRTRRSASAPKPEPKPDGDDTLNRTLIILAGGLAALGLLYLARRKKGDGATNGGAQAEEEPAEFSAFKRQIHSIDEKGQIRLSGR